MAGEKTEAPTPKKREEARKKGQVARSMEISSVSIIIAAFLILQVFGAGMSQQLADLMKNTFHPSFLSNANNNSLPEFASGVVVSFFMIMLPILAGLVLVSLIVNLAQTKLLFSFEAVVPKLSKLNPLSGLKRMFSMRAIVELGKSMFKVTVCGFIGYLVIVNNYSNLLALQNSSLETSLVTIAVVAMQLGLTIGVALIAMAIIDYIYQRQQFESSIKMSKEEVKQEFKQQEGDPQIKGRIRQLQRILSSRRMMQSVPKADVVVTNPIHLAIALKYDPLKDSAPIVVAKGERLLAERIKELAKENGVPILENKPLAQALYKMVEIGDEIPPSLYQAVAEVLAFIYQLRRSGMQPSHA